MKDLKGKIWRIVGDSSLEKLHAVVNLLVYNRFWCYGRF